MRSRWLKVLTAGLEPQRPVYVALRMGHYVRMDTKDAGRIGGKHRAANMAAKQRSEAARKAVLARWGEGEEAQAEAKRLILREGWVVVEDGADHETALRSPILPS